MIVANPEVFRQNVVEKLNTYIFCKKKCKNIEKSIYNYSLKYSDEYSIVKKWDNKYFVLIYKNKLRSLFMNISRESTTYNDLFVKNINNGLIKSKKVGFMTHQEINPDTWKVLIAKKVQRDKSKYETNKKGASSEFKCRKCHKRETEYIQLQTRSADEPMTTYVTCLNCGNHWKC